MHVGIDGDILLYRCGFAAQSVKADGTVVAEPVEFALHSTKLTINKILKNTGSSEYTVFLSGADNFRLLVDTDYKANRKDFVKPIHYEAIKQYLLDKHHAVRVDGMEADDALGMWLYTAASKHDMSKCYRTLASLDKDLDMIPGWHYNFNHNRLYWIDDDYANHVFFRQLLTGDTVDNIPGIPGMGNVTADKYLGDYVTTEDAMNLIKSAYLVWEPDPVKAADRMWKNMHLLWIRRYVGSEPLGLQDVFQGREWIHVPDRAPVFTIKNKRIVFNGKKDSTVAGVSGVDNSKILDVCTVSTEAGTQQVAAEVGGTGT